MTALHWAAKRGNLEILKILIEAGADIDARDIVILPAEDNVVNLINRLEEHRYILQFKKVKWTFSK